MVCTKVGYFTLSTQSGFGMVNHPTDFIELAPERYAVVRDVLTRTRDARIAEVAHSRNTIWYAWPEIQRVTGGSLPEAFRQLQAMCKEMFIPCPGRCAISAAGAWVDFWIFVAAARWRDHARSTAARPTVQAHAATMAAPR